MNRKGNATVWSTRALLKKVKSAVPEIEVAYHMPMPAIAISFRTFSAGCDAPLRCAVEIADTGLQQGQGMHGTFSRADTNNFMAAIGPDFKAGFVDPAPVSNAESSPASKPQTTHPSNPSGPMKTGCAGTGNACRTHFVLLGGPDASDLPRRPVTGE